MRTLGLTLALSLLALSFTHSPALAGAKKEADALPKIEMTGIAEFDGVFSKAKAIHDGLDGEDASLSGARKDLNVALGLADTGELAGALTDLKSKAQGKVKIAMKGKTPHLEPSDAIPENVQKGLDAFNGLTDKTSHAIDTATALIPDAKALVVSVADFPAKLLKMGMDPKVLKAKKTITADIDATKSTPARIDRLIKTCEGIFTDIKGAFGG